MKWPLYVSKCKHYKCTWQDNDQIIDDSCNEGINQVNQSV